MKTFWKTSDLIEQFSMHLSRQRLLLWNLIFRSVEWSKCWVHYVVLCQENCYFFTGFQSKVVIQKVIKWVKAKSSLFNKSKWLFDPRLVPSNFIVSEFLLLSLKATNLFLGRWPIWCTVLSILLKFSFLNRLVQAALIFIVSESFPRLQAGT